MSTQLILLRPELLNPGIYNFTFEIVDTSTQANQPPNSHQPNLTAYWSSLVTSKLLVLNETLAANASILAQLNGLLDAWSREHPVPEMVNPGLITI